MSSVSCRGALLRFGCMAGAIMGGAGGAEWNALDGYASALGQAFQIADDLLDLEGDPLALGVRGVLVLGVVGGPGIIRRDDCGASVGEPCRPVHTPSMTRAYACVSARR